MADVTVRVRPLDQPWETIGTGNYRGITPQGVLPEWDEGGPSNLTFLLRRDTKANSLDIGAGAEIEVDIAGRVNVWEGYVSETPKRAGGDQVWTVTCRGWQSILDDEDVIDGVTLVHSTLTDFKDARSYLDCDLVQFVSAPTINTDGGITVMFPKGMASAAGIRIAMAVVDLGPDGACKRAVLQWKHSASDANTYMLLRGADTVADLHSTGTYEDVVVTTVTGTATGTTAGTFSTPRRYVAFGLFNGMGTAIAAETWARARKILLFGDTAYESGNASVFTSDLAVAKALALGTVGLSADRSKIQASTFAIPDCQLDWKGTSPRDLIRKVAAYEDWLFKLLPGRVPSWGPRPSTPALEVGEWTALPQDDDTSANALAPIYNRVAVCATSPEGLPVRVKRSAADVATSGLIPVGITADNPSADVNTTSWTKVLGTLTRDTSIRHTAPASIRHTAAHVLTSFTGTFLAGRTYRFSAWVYLAAGNANVLMRVNDGTNTFDLGYSPGPLVTSTGLPATTWTRVTGLWTPRVDCSTAQLEMWGWNPVGPSTAGIMNFDDVQVETYGDTVLDRRGRRRTMILEAATALPLDGAAATKIADAFLAAHKTTPFKGEAQIQGAMAVRMVVGGQGVDPVELGLRTGELLRFNDRGDPDTGGWCREGRLVSVKYDCDTGVATISIDNTSARFDGLLARIGLLTGS